MFDWFWEFLYSLTAGICKLIDGVITCANKLCGIDDIEVDGEATDFLSFLLRTDEIRLAFSVATIVGLILVVFFSVFAIVRNVAKGKPEESPIRVAMKALKAILTFLFVPTCMIIAMWCLNTIMEVMYAATLNGTAAGLGSYLIAAFSKEGSANFAPGFDYTDASGAWDYFNLKKYNYFFSWIAGFVILFETAKSLIMFVDRAIEIVILFIVSPFSISASILDDGSHFKLWRDQVIIKFMMGYGTILGLNIYAMLVAIVSRDDVVFFPDSSFANFLIKVLFVVGGAFSLQRIMGLIGNLIQSGAGTQEMQQAAMANAAFGRTLGKIGSAVGTVTGAKALGGAISKRASDAVNKKINGGLDKVFGHNETADEKFQNSVTSSLGKIGAALGGGGATAKDAISGKSDEKKDENKNDAVKDAVGGNDDNKSGDKSDNGNHNMMNDALSGGIGDTQQPTGADSQSGSNSNQSAE